MTGHQPPSSSTSPLNQRLDVTFALQAAGLGVWELDPVTKQVLWDERCRELFGLAQNNPLSYEQAGQYIHPDDAERVNRAVAWAMNPQSDGAYDQTHRTIGADDGQLRWVRFQGKASFSSAGQVSRFAGVAQEVTHQELGRQQLEKQTNELSGTVYELQQSEDRYRLLSEQLEEQIRQRIQDLKALNDELAATNEKLAASNEELVTANEDQVKAYHRVEESEAKLRAIIAAAPAGIGLFVGRDLVIELPNQPFIDIVGKGPDVEGLPLREAMPELLAEGQPFLNILDEVYTTGVPFLSPASLVKIVQNGILQNNYYNISYTPIRDASGQIYAILDIAIDVTEQIQAQQALAAKEAALSNTIELAELGTFSVDVTTQVITVSPRVASWFGFDSLTAAAELFIGGVGESDREQVETSLVNAMRPGSDGRYDVVHSVVHARTGRQIIIHALGQLYFDVAGNPIKLEGTAQDVTAERKQQLFLEQQVQQRTEELACVNEELAAINEELTASNEELLVTNEASEAANRALEMANTDLVRSNQNLEQFAYIASHDLQEPLRKIQQFGDLLKTRYAHSSGEEMIYLERMQSAAGRMSLLIRDLLAFSRIATSQAASDRVSLNEVVSDVLDNLSVTIEETKAQILVDRLPTVQGDKTQLGQLFLNLLSNALKFSRKDLTGAVATPQISVKASQVFKAALPASIMPARNAEVYWLIEVKDNGIGFDEKYLDRIFQVFQRLHGRSEFAGTGIGLAISEKVITNHGGVLTASSQVGQGAIFSVYLPS